MFQTTLQEEFTFSGVGLHSGLCMSVRVLPTIENMGIQFKRTDVLNCEFARISPFNVSSTQLATTIKCGDFPISTIEHLVSALYGLGVDNALVEVGGPEVPILDGSAGPIAELIVNTGIKKLSTKRRYLTFNRGVCVEMDDKLVSAQPDDTKLTISLEIEYPHKAINKQARTFTLTPEVYIQTVAHARTFGFQKDVEALWKMGLAKGGSMDNAIVLDNKDGILNPDGLRSKDEFVNHKILDLIGDISLIGYRICGNIHAVKSGHHINNVFARKVLETMNSYTLKETKDIENCYGFLSCQGV